MPTDRVSSETLWLLLWEFCKGLRVVRESPHTVEKNETVIQQVSSV
jgi:hypothetical protein